MDRELQLERISSGQQQKAATRDAMFSTAAGEKDIEAHRQAKFVNGSMPLVCLPKCDLRTDEASGVIHKHEVRAASSTTYGTTLSDRPEARSEARTRGTIAQRRRSRP